MPKHKYFKRKEVCSYSFYSKDLNKGKYECFLKKAEEIRVFKNLLSKEICNNLLTYLNYTKFDLIKKFGSVNNPIYQSKYIRSTEYQRAVDDVITAYQNKFNNVTKKIQFKVQKAIKIERYKRKTKENNVGDIKSYEIIKKSTPLTTILSYLARYYDPEIKKYLEKKIPTVDKKKAKFFSDIISVLEKYGEDRILNLVLKRRELVLKKYCYPIEFKTLTYRSAIQHNAPIIQNNKGFSNAYIILKSINGSKSRDIVVPVDFNLQYHGHLNQYKSKEYIVSIVKNRVRFILTKEKKRKYLINGENLLGVDTNIKNNLFVCSTGDIIDFDRELLNRYTRFLNKFDKEKKTKGEIELYNLYQVRIKNELKKKCSELVDLAIKNGKDHLILEDLGIFGKSYIRNLEFNGIKYSRLIKLLNLSNLKNIAASVCRKKGIQLTLIPSYYTSQMCNKCGFISRDNRKTQENFKCVNCGYENNSDLNSAINIYLIACQEVLGKRSLLQKNSSKWLVPKTLSKSKIKDHLEEIVISPFIQKQRAELQL